MNFNQSQKNLAVIAIIVLSLVGVWWYVTQCKEQLTPEELTCSTSEKLLPAVDALPIALLAGIMIGAIAFYILSQQKTKPDRDNKQILSLLSEDEKIVFQRLVDKDGEALQSDLTRLDGMTKLKSHRAIKKLELKNLVVVQKKGKTNIVKLSNN